MCTDSHHLKRLVRPDNTSLLPDFLFLVQRTQPVAGSVFRFIPIAVTPPIFNNHESVLLLTRIPRFRSLSQTRQQCIQEGETI